MTRETTEKFLFHQSVRRLKTATIRVISLFHHWFIRHHFTRHRRGIRLQNGNIHQQRLAFAIAGSNAVHGSIGVQAAKAVAKPRAKLVQQALQVGQHWVLRRTRVEAGINHGFVVKRFTGAAVSAVMHATIVMVARAVMAVMVVTSAISMVVGVIVVAHQVVANFVHLVARVHSDKQLDHQ